MESLESQMKTLIEKSEISNLLIYYFSTIDDKRFDLAIIEEIFTPDASIIRPNGSETVGQHNILETNRNSFARFKSTQHILTDCMISLEGETATLRANLTGMHLWADNAEIPALNGKHFHAGIVLTAKTTKVDGKWLLSQLVYRNIWRTGEGFSQLAAPAKEQKTKPGH